MRNLAKIRKTLEELNTTVKPNDEVAEDVKSLEPTNEEFDGYLKEAVTLTLFEKYGIYLIKRQKMSTDEVTQQLEKIMSVFYERGDINVSAIKHVKEYFKEYNVHTKARGMELCKHELMEHIVFNEIGELMVERNVSMTTEMEEIKTIVQLEKDLKLKKAGIINKYKVAVSKNCEDVMSNYKGLFDEEFLEEFNKFV